MRGLSLDPLHTAAPRSPTDGETRMFYEIVIAPGYTPEGLEVLKGKSKALRILEAKLRPPSGRSLRQVAAGWLYQVGCCKAMCGGQPLYVPGICTAGVGLSDKDGEMGMGVCAYQRWMRATGAPCSWFAVHARWRWYGTWARKHFPTHQFHCCLGEATLSPGCCRARTTRRRRRLSSRW